MGTEKCPFCGQEIDTEATRCFFCGANLDEESVEKRLEQLYLQQDRRFARNIGSSLLPKVIAVLILIYIVLFHGEPPGKRSRPVIGPPESPVVRLNAKVAIAGRQLVVSNNDSFDWENVKMEIASGVPHDPFVLSIPKISAGQSYTLEAEEFRRKDGARLDPSLAKPQRVWIRCETPKKESGFYMAGWE